MNTGGNILIQDNNERLKSNTGLSTAKRFTCLRQPTKKVKKCKKMMFLPDTSYKSTLRKVLIVASVVNTHARADGCLY